MTLRALAWNVTLLAVGCGAPLDRDAVGSLAQASMTVCGAPAGGAVQGVDVSKYQGAFNWAAHKSGGTVFGYASIGDGTGSPDPDFQTNWTAMKSAGVLRVAYQFFEPGEDPTAQANLMVQAVGKLGAGDLPCMVDVEVSGGQSGATIAAHVRTWLGVVQAGTGRPPIVYTGPSFWDGSVGDTSFGAVPLWIADYGPSCPAVPNGWSNWTIWQYGDSGGALDQDVFNGSLAQLQALGGPTCSNQCAMVARVGLAAAPTGEGTWMVDAAGHVLPNGDASFFGDLSGVTLAQPVVAIAATPSGQGYWLAAADGGVFAFGAAGFHGSEGGKPLNAPIVGIAAVPDGAGYWLVGSDGGVFAFGSAGFFGSAGGMKLNKPVVGLAATPTGKGYWLVAADGGIFAYGDAAFEGSAGSMKLNAPIVAMAATSTGKGYWLVGSDGGIFAYGDAAFEGSAGSMKLNAPIVGLAVTSDDKGYWLGAEDGGVFTYGDAPYLGNGLGATCAGGVPQQCVLAASGCTALMPLTACAAGSLCAHGTCQSSCTDACTSGASQCSGGDVQVCGHFGSAPCNGWSTPVACPAGLTCANGVCGSTVCSDDCQPGATECMGGQLLTCTAIKAGGCHSWSAPTACQSGQLCQAGGCVSGADGGSIPLVDAAANPTSDGSISLANDARASLPDSGMVTGGALSSGCGCTLGGREGEDGWSVLSLLIVLLLVTRRRRA